MPKRWLLPIPIGHSDDRLRRWPALRYGAEIWDEGTAFGALVSRNHLGRNGVGPNASIQLGARPRAYSPREDLHHKWARQLVESCDLLVVGPEDHMLRRSLRRPTCRVRAGSATGRRWRPRSMYAYVDGYAGGG
jgi:hypothetical protein